MDYKIKIHWQCSLLLLAFLPSCTLLNGQPWGEIESIEFLAEFPVEGTRLIDSQTFSTNNDFHLSVDELVINYSGVLFVMSDQSDGSSFDPSNPPDGCGLCHNGHCHCGDELVSYEDLQTQMVSEGGGATLDLPMTGDMPTFQPNSEAAQIPVFNCSDADRCFLPRGTLKAITIKISSVELQATVTDTRTGANVRLDTPLDVNQIFPLNAQLNVVVDEVFDKNTTTGLAVSISHQVPVALFDSIEEWAAFESEYDLMGQTIGQNIENADGLAIDLVREEPSVLPNEDLEFSL